MLTLGFRFDVDAVIIGGIAHRSGCDRLQRPLSDHAVLVRAAGVHRTDRCPRKCPQCRPAFETLLSYGLERPLAAIAP